MIGKPEHYPVPRYIVLTKTRCLPCRQVHSLLDGMILDGSVNAADWHTKWYHDDPDFFEKLCILSVPAIIEQVTMNEYSIKAIGLPEIQKYMNELITNKNLNEEEE